jgi:hypothetical protein
MTEPSIPQEVQKLIPDAAVLINLYNHAPVKSYTQQSAFPTTPNKAYRFQKG